MKGASDIIVIILILLISLSLIGLVYTWSTGVLFQSYPKESQEKEYLRSRACLSMENINVFEGNAVLRNCGQIPLTKFKVYVDNAFSITSVPDKLEPDEEIGIGLPSFTVGNHSYYATSDYAETVVYTLSP